MTYTAATTAGPRQPPIRRPRPVRAASSLSIPSARPGWRKPNGTAKPSTATSAPSGVCRHTGEPARLAVEAVCELNLHLTPPELEQPPARGLDVLKRLVERKATMIRVELGGEVDRHGRWRWTCPRYGLRGVSGRQPLLDACRGNQMQWAATPRRLQGYSGRRGRCPVMTCEVGWGANPYRVGRCQTAGSLSPSGRPIAMGMVRLKGAAKCEIDLQNEPTQVL